MDTFELEQPQSEESRAEGDNLHDGRQYEVGLFVVGLYARRQHVGLEEYDDD